MFCVGVIGAESEGQEEGDDVWNAKVLGNDFAFVILAVLFVLAQKSLRA